MRNIDTDLLAKLNLKNQTAWNNAQPKMNIQVSRAKTTVTDSSYWTVETIRNKQGVGDLSVAARRMRSYGSPDKLFNVYIDNGLVKGATRDYPDYEEQEWQDQFSLGPGAAVAIAFDGYWEIYRKKWQMVTHAAPWIFWVNNGNLSGQIWDDSSSKIDLADNVSKVKAIRGWRNVNIHEIDQGLIVAYIKSDGKVYYRNYAYQEDGSVIWENEKRVTQFTGTASNLNLFITNDYRIGFVVEDTSSNIHLYISERAWAGMAILPDKFFVSAGTQISLIPINKVTAKNNERIIVNPISIPKLLYADSFNKFEKIENVDNGEGDFGTKVLFKTAYQIKDFNFNDFELVDSNGVRFSGMDGNVIDGWHFELFFPNFNNAAGALTLRCLGIYSTNEAGTFFDEFGGSFVPVNLCPVAIDPPEVEAIWNE